MADHLITTTAQLRAAEPISANFKIEEILPKIHDVEQEFIIPIIGQDLFDYLRALATPAANDLELLTRCRNALAKLAILKWIPYGNLAIQSGGFTVNGTSSTMVAAQWRVDKLEEDMRREGWNALERILTYLWSKPDGTWNDWDSSDEKIEHRNWLITSAGEFNKYYFIDSSYELFCRVKPGQREVMNQFIRPVLGDDLYDQIIDQITGNELSVDNTALMEYIKRAVAPLTIYESGASLGVDLSHWGITTTENADNGDNTKIKKPAASDRLSYALRKAGDDGRKHLGAIRAFLNNNASSTKYALYYDSDLYQDPALLDDEEDGDMINKEDSGVFIM